jgi:5-methylcytosine-specific restriction enzyme subunit McrC
MMSEINLARRPETVVLTEHDTPVELDLSDPALDALEEVNADKTRINVTFTRDGTTELKATEHVGALALPDGPMLQIQPKAVGTNFLRLLTYAHGVEAQTIDRKTDAAHGPTFVDAFAALFAAHMDTVLQRSPHKSYRRIEEQESHLRGQLDLPRQLQRQGQHGTDFEVRYDELTTDTTANRALYQATRRLAQLVTDEDLSQALHQQQRELRRWISPEPVRVAEVATLETTRLNAHYEVPLELAEQILQSSFLDGFSSESSQSFGLLMNMNRVFERVVERAASEAVQDWSGWSVKTQSHLDPIVTSEGDSFTMQPDFVVRDGENIRLIGDAKWKTSRVKSSDIYQMTSYQLAHEVPGMLVYPEQDRPSKTDYSLHAAQDALTLRARRLPTATPVESFDEFVSGLRTRLKTDFEELCDI